MSHVTRQREQLEEKGTRQPQTLEQKRTSVTEHFSKKQQQQQQR
jgi:hypothetical protein